MTDSSERVVPPPKDDPGNRENDDHVMGPTPRGRGQDPGDLDRGVGDEHVSSPSQGVRPEPIPDEDRA
jgi:hypothetical protein